MRLPSLTATRAAARAAKAYAKTILPQVSDCWRWGRHRQQSPGAAQSAARLALTELDTRAFIEIPAPQLASQRRKIVLAWNPRTLRLREHAAALAAALKTALALP